MEALAHCDTHVALWLYLGEPDRFGKKAIEVIENCDVLISPAVYLELQFLYEIERIKEKPWKILDTLRTDFGVSVCDDPFLSVVEAAMQNSWTRDPFDRLIVAHAALRHVPLVTKDAHIRGHYKRCVW